MCLVNLQDGEARCLPVEGTLTDFQIFPGNLLAMIEQDDPAKGEVVCSIGVFCLNWQFPQLHSAYGLAK